MSNLRDQVISALKKLPLSATAEVMQYTVYVLEKLRRGEQAIHNRETLTHQEAKHRLRKWLDK